VTHSLAASRHEFELFALIATCLILLLPIRPARAEVIDRLAIAVGHEVITELQLDEELRVTAMLNHKPVLRSLEERRAAADRLVEQLLIKREMQLSRYSLPDSTDIDKYYLQIEQANGGAAELDKTLRESNLTPETLRSHLELQLTELKFIEVRFRPDVMVSDADVEAAYQRQAAAWPEAHPGQPQPSLEASREPLRQMLLEQRTDAALNTWLGESRKRVRVVYFDKALE
jgi:hypothetical protein